jgi:hypothetical protein
MRIAAVDRLELLAGLDFSPDDDQPVFTIDFVAEVLGVPQEMVYALKRCAGLNEDRKLYSRVDVMRYEFVKHLLDTGFDPGSVKAYLLSYPCWSSSTFRLCQNVGTADIPGARVCWKDPGVRCDVATITGSDLCERQSLNVPV